MFFFFWSETRYSLPSAAGLLWFTKTSGEALTHICHPQKPRGCPYYRDDQKGDAHSATHVLGHVALSLIHSLAWHCSRNHLHLQPSGHSPLPALLLLIAPGSGDTTQARMPLIPPTDFSSCPLHPAVA